MKRRHFLWTVAVAGGTSLLNASRGSFASTLAPSENVDHATLLRMVESPIAADNHLPGACAWMAHPDRCATSAPRWRINLHGLVRGNTSALQALRVSAEFSDGNGAIHPHALYGFDVDRDSGQSKPVGFAFDAAALDAFALTGTSRVGETWQLRCPLAGRLQPGRYVVFTERGGRRIDSASLDFSGDSSAPLRHRDGRAVAFDYLAFDVIEDAA